MPTEVQRLKLWRVLERADDDQQRAFVKGLVDYVAPILDRVIETFPTYTLHNSQHSWNVAEIMAELLGDRLMELQPLEAALLILAAYFHDAGMVFDDQERANLTREPQWQAFLSKFPDAYLTVNAQNELPRDVAENYCRWRHADRVFVYLNDLAADRLRWGSVSIREELGELCRSHNLSVSEVRASPKLRTAYLEAADLRFCAILLRLADILDFDRSRSPEAVYKQLGLARRSSRRSAASDVEWRKHLHSDGMKFPSMPQRKPSYELGFICGPDHPAVEHDVRRFLDVIENEFEECEILLKECSDRWRNLALPGSIKRSDIRPEGYRYGEYRFTLDQDNVLQLLMGESLYDSPFVFVRELIQNAIDASRLRQYLERARGNSEFNVRPVKITQWVDRDRYRWVRFDDFGVGMDEAIIRDHLLKVGSSYYGSAQYKADVLRASQKIKHSFVPVSRFGIGLLSCFIACDRVDISTMRQKSDGSQGEPIRLTLEGLNGFFALQSPNLPAALMPEGSKAEFGDGYRIECGTSIACRLNPAKERGEFSLADLLKKNVFCPPVPVEFDGELIGGDFEEIAGNPWCQRQTVRLSQMQVIELNEFVGWERMFDEVTIEVLPIDISRATVSKDFRGQVVVFSLRGLDLPEHMRYPVDVGLSTRQLNRSLVVKINLELSEIDQLEGHYTNVNLRAQDEEVSAEEVKYKAKIKSWYAKMRRMAEAESSRGGLRREHSVALPQLDEIISREATLGLDGRPLRISHNGISVPISTSGAELTLDSYGLSDIAAIGALVLQDKARPDLSLARDKIKDWPWELVSVGDLTFCKVLEAFGELGNVLPTLIQTPLVTNLTLGRLMEDPLISGGHWDEQRIFKTEEGELLSLCGLRSKFVDKTKIILTDIQYAQMQMLPSWRTVVAALAALHLDLTVDDDAYYWRSRLLVTGLRSKPLSDGELLFPPLTFLPFKNSSVLRRRSSILNKNHFISVWLIEHAPMIAERYPGILEVIRSAILTAGYSNKAKSIVENVNGALDRLLQLEPDLGSGKRPSLEEKDIDWGVE